MKINKLTIYGISFFMLCLSALTANVTISNTGGGNLSSLGGLDSKWFYSVSSSLDLSQQATVMYPNSAYQPGYPSNPSDPGFNSPLSRFLGTANNNGTFLDGGGHPVTNGTVSDPAGTYYFNTVVDGLGTGNFLFRYETDNVLTNIYVNGISLFASIVDFNNFISQASNPANNPNQEFFGFNGYYVLPGLNAGDILSFEVLNQAEPGNPVFGNPTSFRAEFLATPEPVTYMLLGSFLLIALYILPRRQTAKG